MKAKSSGAGSSQNQSSIASKIDFNNLWKYTPENEAEEKMLNNALECYEKAEDLNDRYIKGSKSSYSDPAEMVRAYSNFVEKSGQVVDPEDFFDLLDVGDSSQEYEFARDQYLELAESVLEDYIDLKEKKLQAKKVYLRHFGTDDFDVDPNKGPVLKQVTTQEIISHFFDKQAKTN